MPTRTGDNSICTRVAGSCIFKTMKSRFYSYQKENFLLIYSLVILISDINLNHLDPSYKCNVASKRLRLIKMSDHYGDDSQSASDQEELVGETDIDDDYSDTEEMQFTFCKSNIEIERTRNTNGDDDGSMHIHTIQSKFIFFGMVVTLFLSAFVLLICFPLYLQQLNVGQKKSAYGALLFVSTLITLLLMLSTLVGWWILKWNVVLYKLPLPWRR